MSEEDQEKFIHHSWAEMTAEMEEEEPRLNRLVRLEGVWFDISTDIAERPEDTAPVDPMQRSASVHQAQAGVNHALTLHDPVILRDQLIQLAAAVVEWVEELDADKDEP